MNSLFSFTVLGPPVAKGRPRVVKRGKFVHAFTPSRTVEFEERVAMAALESYHCAGLDGSIGGPLDRPLACRVRFYMQKPARKGTQFMDRRPDLENLVKSLWDGMERGGVVKDDARFVELEASKHYDENPRTEVEIGEPDAYYVDGLKR